jgi:hypothetical protein
VPHDNTLKLPFVAAQQTITEEPSDPIARAILKRVMRRIACHDDRAATARGLETTHHPWLPVVTSWICTDR